MDLRSTRSEKSSGRTLISKTEISKKASGKVTYFAGDLTLGIKDSTPSKLPEDSGEVEI